MLRYAHGYNFTNPLYDEMSQICDKNTTNYKQFEKQFLMYLVTPTMY